MTVLDLIQAQGKVTVFLASLFSRAGVVSFEEFAALLDTYGLIVGETEPEQGELLTLWAATVRAVEDDATVG